MMDSAETLTAQAEERVPLTRGLVRNTFFNLVGWAWPILVSFVSIPYIVSGLGNDAYGVFGIAFVVADFLSLVNGPLAMGNVRFMAEAYGRRDWRELRETAVAGTVAIGGLSVLGAGILALIAGVLARSVFKIPDELVDDAILVLRLGAVNFFLSGTARAFWGIPAAMRRYDLLNMISVLTGTLGKAAIVTAVWLGWGLLGAVAAQVFSSALTLMVFAALAWLYLRRLPDDGQISVFDGQLAKQLISFSSLIFIGQIASTIGLRMDRILVSILLGTTPMTFYTVPTNITDKIPGLVSSLTRTLYPLSAEAWATSNLGELKRLYMKVAKLLLWLSGFLGTVLIVLSKHILLLWVGPEFAANSWLVLTLLAATWLWRAPASLAYQVCNGLGRADVSMWMSWVTLLSFSIPSLLLTPRFGINGTALGILLGSVLAPIAFNIFVQRRLIGQLNWWTTLKAYAKPIFVYLAIVASSVVMPFGDTGWISLLAKGAWIAIGATLGVMLLDRPLVEATYNRFIIRIRAVGHG